MYSIKRHVHAYVSDRCFLINIAEFKVTAGLIEDIVRTKRPIANVTIAVVTILFTQLSLKVIVKSRQVLIAVRNNTYGRAFIVRVRRSFGIITLTFTATFATGSIIRFRLLI